MGCAQSKIDNEESVSRCKDRKILMKEAVTARNAFAAGHSGYAMSLKNTGAALGDYGHGEVDQALVEEVGEGELKQPAVAPPPPPPIENLPPPPPPLPKFTPSPIKRAISMPPMPVKLKFNGGGEGRDSFAIAEGEEEEEAENAGGRTRGGVQEVTPPETPESRGNAADKESPLPPPPPPMPESKNLAWDYFFMVDNMPGPSLNDREIENEEENQRFHEEEDENEAVQFHGNRDDGGEIEPKTPEKAVEERYEEEDEDDEKFEDDLVLKKGKMKIEHSNTAPPEFGMSVKTAAVANTMTLPSVNLMKVLEEIDDHFLKASESAQEVSKLLEATRLHYHSNFADNRGHIDHSARVMRVITWNRSFKGASNGEGGKDDPDSEDYETHATVLDKLLAWEKKLYDEVKQGELMKLEYQRKVSMLNKQKKRSASAETLEKTKAAVSHLHTRYIVDMQSMDSTVSEVNQIRDEQLYPKLVTLVEGMARMWERMSIHHDSQLEIVSDLKSLDIAHAPKETTKHHHDRTRQLCNIVEEWQTQFDKLVTHQKQYIQALNSWLKLNLIPIESSLKEKISSPPRPQNPPIQALLHAWHSYLDKLPDELARSAITSFVAVFRTILIHQDEEIKLKEKCEETRKEYIRKNHAFEEWYEKYMQKRGPEDMEGGGDPNVKDPVLEKRFVVESLKKRLDDEVEAHQKLCLQVREKSLGSLKIRLPELFRAMAEFAHACSDAYEKLRSMNPSQKPNGVHS